MVDSRDIITYANFGEDWLRGLGVVGGQSLPFFIDFDRHHYNTHTPVRVCNLKEEVPCSVGVTKCDCCWSFLQAVMRRSNILLA